VRLCVLATLTSRLTTFRQEFQALLKSYKSIFLKHLGAPLVAQVAQSIATLASAGTSLRAPLPAQPWIAYQNTSWPIKRSRLCTRSRQS